MRNEVCFSPDAGLVRVGHVRAALGFRLHEMKAVELVVPVAPVATERVDLVAKRSGRGVHVVFACPACQKPRSVLYATEERRLLCARCSGRKTRHQMESSRTDWKDNGLELEDRLFRAVLKKNHTPAGLRRLRSTARDLVTGDQDRLSSAIELAEAALLAVSTLHS